MQLIMWKRSNEDMQASCSFRVLSQSPKDKQTMDRVDCLFSFSSAMHRWKARWQESKLSDQTDMALTKHDQVKHIKIVSG